MQVKQRLQKTTPFGGAIQEAGAKIIKSKGATSDFMEIERQRGICFHLRFSI
jgi:peptide subunit release factor RF-3